MEEEKSERKGKQMGRSKTVSEWLLGRADCQSGDGRTWQQEKGEGRAGEAPK